MSEPVLAWHFLADDGRLRFGDRPVVTAGSTLAATGRLSLCNNGMHASLRAFDALQYAPGSVVCRVELSGQIVHGDDKLCARKRHVLWMADATQELHAFSADAAEWILDRLAAKDYKIDLRSRAAVEAKRRWLRGEITDKELAAAWSAAWADAGDAAGADAGDAALHAAWHAARDELNTMLERRLLALEGPV